MFSQFINATSSNPPSPEQRAVVTWWSSTYPIARLGGHCLSLSSPISKLIATKHHTQKPNQIGCASGRSGHFHSSHISHDTSHTKIRVRRHILGPRSDNSGRPIGRMRSLSVESGDVRTMDVGRSRGGGLLFLK